MVVSNMTIPDYNMTIPEHHPRGHFGHPLFEGSWANPLVFLGKTPHYSVGTRKPLFPEGTLLNMVCDMPEW
jgi:hypothetical protein